MHLDPQPPAHLACSSAIEVKASAKPCSNGSSRSNNPRPSSVSETDRVVRSRTRIPRRCLKTCNGTAGDRLRQIQRSGRIGKTTASDDRNEDIGIAQCLFIESHDYRFQRNTTMHQLREPPQSVRASYTRAESSANRGGNMVAVTGITGKVGSQVARSLLAQGQTVRAVVRSREKGDEWAALGCEIQSRASTTRRQ